MFPLPNFIEFLSVASLLVPLWLAASFVLLVGSMQFLDDGNIRLVPTGKILVEEQARKHFVQEEIGELAADIRSRGLLNPLIVAWDTQRAIYRLVSGERRLRALHLNGMTEAPCRVIDSKVSQADLLAVQINENAQRADLRPCEFGRSLAHLQQLHNNCSVSELAKIIHKPVSLVSKKLALLKAPIDLQEMVDDGKLPESLVYQLTQLTDPVVVRELVEAYLAGNLNRDGVAKAVKARLGKPSKNGEKKITVKTSGGSFTVAESASVTEVVVSLENLAKKAKRAKAETLTELLKLLEE